MAMLYVHQLNLFTPKNAELESVYLIRELKQKTPYPFRPEALQATFSPLFVSATDIQVMEQALPLIPQMIEKLNELLRQQDTVYEAVNIQRAIQTLQEMPTALQNNLTFAQNVLAWQETAPNELLTLFHAIPRVRTPEERTTCNQQVNTVLQTVLRTNQLYFYHDDIVHEAHTSHLAGLRESLSKGFLFHIFLEEEIKKLPYVDWKERLPSEAVAEVEGIERNIQIIQKGIDRAYQLNMRMINCGLIIYSYIKWMMSEAGMRR